MGAKKMIVLLFILGCVGCAALVYQNFGLTIQDYLSGYLYKAYPSFFVHAEGKVDKLQLFQEIRSNGRNGRRSLYIELLTPGVEIVWEDKKGKQFKTWSNISYHNSSLPFKNANSSALTSKFTGPIEFLLETTTEGNLSEFPWPIRNSNPLAENISDQWLTKLIVSGGLEDHRNKIDVYYLNSLPWINSIRGETTFIWRGPYDVSIGFTVFGFIFFGWMWRVALSDVMGQNTFLAISTWLLVIFGILFFVPSRPYGEWLSRKKYEGRFMLKASPELLEQARSIQ